jgi:hypothetical protein
MFPHFPDNLLIDGGKVVSLTCPQLNENVVMGCKRRNIIFWDCKLYEDQRATMMDFLSENSKKEYAKSVTELLRLEEKRFLQGVCYLINEIPKFIFKKVEILIIYS